MKPPLEGPLPLTLLKSSQSGVSRPMIARMEKGDQNRVPTLNTINKVFKCLGYEVELGLREVA